MGRIPAARVVAGPAIPDDVSPYVADPKFRLFDAPEGVGLLVVDGSRVHVVSEAAADLLTWASADGGEDSILRAFETLGLSTAPVMSDSATDLPIRSLSLAIAQKCNLGCTYCYASGGAFGGAPKSMSEEVAFAAVDALFRDANAHETVFLSFLGGEPLTNRATLRAATERAAEWAQRQGVNVRFSLTTNGTLLNEVDFEFLNDFDFAVTVSLDGLAEEHDRQRPFKNGRGSFESVVKRIRPFLSSNRRAQVSARVTVTPLNLKLRSALDALIDMGFDSVGFSPMLASPTSLGEMDGQALASMLEQMIDCGREFERRAALGVPYPFANLATALQEIHRGTHRPYSCGAGHGYLGVSADGELSACHRFVDDPLGRMGDLIAGIDEDARENWLRDRHVHRQEPCRVCWARYLCGGGCHHEVIHRGRPACDYIRGWLTYCLEAYLRLVSNPPTVRPDRRTAIGAAN